MARPKPNPADYADFAERFNVPASGSEEASSFVDRLEKFVQDTGTHFGKELLPAEELRAFATKTGLNGLTEQIARESGPDLLFTAPPEPKKVKKARRARMAI